MKSRKSFTKPGKKHAIWKEKRLNLWVLVHIGDGEWTQVIRVSTFEYLSKTRPGIRGFFKCISYLASIGIGYFLKAFIPVSSGIDTGIRQYLNRVFASRPIQG